MTQSTAIQQDENVIDSEAPSALAFTIDRSLLLKALGHVQSVVERRNTIPILSNVKLEASGGEVSFTTTDMDIAITEKIETEVTTEGALTVPAHTLYEIIRKLPEGSQIELSGDASESGKLEINSGSCDFSLSCLPAKDFPVMDKGDMSHNFSLAAAELIALIDKTRFAISTEETRYYLNGIFLHAKDKFLCAVATDGHRLAKIEIDAPDGSAGIPGIIVPRKTVVELKKLIEESESEIEISVSETKICFVSDNAVLVSKVIDGTFPDYDKVIPSGNDKTMTINTETFAKSVDRVSTISLDKTKAVKFSVTSGKLTLSAANEDNGTACEEIDVSYTSSPVEIGLNSRYVLEMLSVIEGDEVEFVFADNAAPILVKDTVDETALYVIMPMRI